MSLVTTSELTTHMRLSAAPNGAAALISTAEAVVASHLEIADPASGRLPLFEHSVVERFKPVRDKQWLEVSGGPISGIDNIYTVSGTTVTTIGKNPIFQGWAAGSHDTNGGLYTFEQGQEYVLEYRTGWAGTDAATVYDFKNDGSFSLQGWTSKDNSDVATSNLAEGTTTRMRWTQTDRHEWLHSPGSLTLSGSGLPFVTMRLGLTNTPTLNDWEVLVEWKASGSDSFYSEARSARFAKPFRVTSSAADPMSILTLDMTRDTEGKGFEEIQGLVQPTQTLRRWIDDTITDFRIQLWAPIDVGTSIAAETLPAIDIDWIRVHAGLAPAPERIKRAILITAASISTGKGSGILSESIGDYSGTFAPGEASEIIPPAARGLLAPYRRPNW